MGPQDPIGNQMKLTFDFFLYNIRKHLQKTFSGYYINMKVEKKKRADIFLIAREAKVSIATVSRVLNKTQTVTEDKKKRVLAACKKYDYKPSHIARAIRTRRTRNIALVIHSLSIFTKNVELIDSIEEKLESYGYCLNIFNTRLNIEKQDDIVNIIDERVIDGVILQGSGFTSKEIDREIIEQLNERKIPSFFIEKYIADTGMPFAVIDGKKGGELAAGHLFDMGHKNIGIITYPLKYTILNDRVRGFVKALKKAGIEPELMWELEVSGHNISDNEVSIEKRAGDIKESKISAIFCTTDILAISLINVLRSNNIKVPGDISVIGFDNHPLLEAIPSKLTTINNDLKLLGEIAADNLVSRIEKGRFLKTSTVIEPELIKRDTVRKI